MAVEIFAEKFRGFERVNLNLREANFITGDNSSGKSSLLLLLDYVIRTELTGPPDLSKHSGANKYDFFSPYFDFSDVTVGFISKGKKRATGKVITLRRRSGGYAPQVTRMTWIDSRARATIKCNERTASFKVGKGCDSLDIEQLLALHRETTGFKSLKLDDDETRLEANSSSMIFAVVRAHGGDEQVSRSIFSSTTLGRLPNVRHSGPLRGLPEPFYHLDRDIKPTGTHFASMWHDLSQEHTSARLEIIKRFGHESGLFDAISVEKISKKISNSPMLVKVNKGGKEFLLGQVGVGVSQVVPVIVESIFESENPDPGLLLLQQPELHLHPVAQAAFGEFMYSMIKKDVNYVIETHSDFLIDRFRSLMRSDDKPPSSQIIFCENSEKGNLATTISINEVGEIGDAPENYKDFFVRELMRTMF